MSFRALSLGLLSQFLVSGSFADTIVAKQMIRPRNIIAEEHLAILSESDGPFQTITEVVGREARRVIYPGQKILPDDIQNPAVIERNAIVPLHFARKGLTIITDGRALSRAANGETVKVINRDSHKTVSGIAMPDGSVLVMR